MRSLCESNFDQLGSCANGNYFLAVGDHIIGAENSDTQQASAVTGQRGVLFQSGSGSDQNSQFTASPMMPTVFSAALNGISK